MWKIKCKDCKFYSSHKTPWSAGFCLYGFYFVEPSYDCIYPGD